MGNICFQEEKEREIPYVNEGTIIILNFRTEDDKWAKPISIHDGNILLKGIQMFKESINLTNARVKNAFYELTSSPLNLYTKIRELNINYSSNIIVYFK